MSYKFKSNMDKVLLDCINQIWLEYDANGNGTLDKQEAKAFVMSCVDEMAGIPMPPAPESDGPEADFDRIFDDLDTDGSGTIS